MKNEKNRARKITGRILITYLIGNIFVLLAGLYHWLTDRKKKD